MKEKKLVTPKPSEDTEPDTKRLKSQMLEYLNMTTPIETLAESNTDPVPEEDMGK